MSAWKDFAKIVLETLSDSYDYNKGLKDAKNGESRHLSYIKGIRGEKSKELYDKGYQDGLMQNLAKN